MSDQLPVLILAGNYAEYRRWVDENKPRPGGVLFCHSMEIIQAVRGISVIEIGTFSLRKDARQMRTAAAARIRPEKL